MSISSKKNSGTSLLSSRTVTAQKPNSQKTVKNIISVKEGEINPTAYVINYNEGGWVIVSGDDRMVPILAYSPVGSFEMTEISELKDGVREWFSVNHNFISKLRNAKNENVKRNNYAKSLWKELEYKSELKKANTSTLTIPTCGALNVGELYQSNETYGPYLGTNWQQSGFGTYCPPAGSCTHANPGCVAIAMAQIMKYHEFPTSFFGHSYNYSLMYQLAPSNDSNQLIADAGFTVSMHYGCSSSWAWFSNIAPALNGWGYYNAVDGAFNFQTVYLNISGALPVILGANRNLTTGHAWVASGVQKNESLICTEVGDIPPGGGGEQSKIRGGTQTKGLPGATYQWVTYFDDHKLWMDWGYGSSNNGWFSENGYTWTVEGHTYSDDREMVTNIFP